MIATLREQREWKESARAAAKKGDRVTINFEGFLMVKLSRAEVVKTALVGAQVQ